MCKTLRSSLMIVLQAVLLAMLLTACGQRGPLYLPDETVAPADTQPPKDALETELDEEDDLRNGDLQYDNATIGSVDEAVDGN